MLTEMHTSLVDSLETICKIYVKSKLNEFKMVNKKLPQGPKSGLMTGLS